MTGKLIGKSGETIKQIQNSTGARVQIDHNFPGDKKAVTVTAPTADAVIAARQQIEQITSDEPAAGETQKTVDCPQGIVGRIIGRGGETIRCPSLAQACKTSHRGIIHDNLLGAAAKNSSARRTEVHEHIRGKMLSRHCWGHVHGRMHACRLQHLGGQNEPPVLH